jgi:hypothetical protein
MSGSIERDVKQIKEKRACRATSTTGLDAREADGADRRIQTGTQQERVEPAP